MNKQATFGAWLKEQRKGLRLTQDALARCAGCSAITVRKIEAGDYRPSREIVQRLVECLDVPSELHEAIADAARAGKYVGRLASRRAGPTNLHRPLTPLIGRERVIKAVSGRLLHPQTPLLTLTGPPGVGKTRLSVQVAAELLTEFEDGVFFVPLATISDPDLVINAMAETLGVRQVGGRPVLSVLKDHLRDKQMLLVLDNFEQVIDAAPVLVELLSLSPYLKLLVTSREALHVRGERQYALPTLDLPDPLERSGEVLAQNPSVRLFAERARAMDPDFDLTDENGQAVAAICVRLDGLPLAIELAAARIKLLSPQEMRTRLTAGGSSDLEPFRLKLLTGRMQDQPARQRTLREAIDWSYYLLDEGEQTLFARLGVFPGSFTLGAAVSVCSARNDLPFEVGPVIESLLDKSLLRPEVGLNESNSIREAEETNVKRRFGMLEIIREYALERLAQSGEAEEMRQRHAEYYLALAETAQPELRRSGQAMWLDRLERERENLRAALAWSLHSGTIEIAVRLAAALGWYWFVLGHVSEGRRWLEAVLARAEESERNKQGRSITLMRSKAMLLSASGRLAVRQADYAAAERQWKEGLALWRELGDQREVAGRLANLGHVALAQGNQALAQSMMKEGLEIWRTLEDKKGIATALHDLGIVAGHEGHYDRAAALLEESLALWRELGDPGALANALQNLAGVTISRGEYSRSALLIDESMALAQRQGIKWLVADAEWLVASLASRLGDYQGCRSALAKCLPYYHEVGHTSSVATCLVLSAHLAYTQAQLPGERIAGLVRAARLLGAAHGLRAASGTAIAHSDPDDTERTLASVKAALDVETFSGAWSEGERMTVEQAVAYALNTGPTGT